jgi:protein-S-isoprenylcysteine O-methyltransferase Ste14
MNAEYRITIGRKPDGPRQNPTRRKLEVVKAVLISVLLLSVVIGVFLASVVVGTLIASILLILVGIAIGIWTLRWFVMKIKKEFTH